MNCEWTNRTTCLGLALKFVCRRWSLSAFMLLLTERKGGEAVSHMQ